MHCIVAIKLLSQWTFTENGSEFEWNPPTFWLFNTTRLTGNCAIRVCQISVPVANSEERHWSVGPPSIILWQFFLNSRQPVKCYKNVNCIKHVKRGGKKSIYLLHGLKEPKEVPDVFTKKKHQWQFSFNKV